ncbi:MAG: CsbD family protein [Chloroflexota bacterium]
MDQESLKGKVEQGTGSVKEKVGQATDNHEMEAEGRNDRDEGKLREAAGTMRERFRDGAETVKDKAGVLGDRLRDAAQRVTRHDADSSNTEPPTK